LTIYRDTLTVYRAYLDNSLIEGLLGKLVL
jgi:hypothetical protein